MIPTFLATARLLRALGQALADPATRGIVALAAAILAGGTAFYTTTEGWSAVDALYFSFVTLTTIGYGDLVPTSTGTKLFTIVYSLVGIGVIAAFVTTLAMTTVRRERAHATEPGRRRPRRRGDGDPGGPDGS